MERNSRVLSKAIVACILLAIGTMEVRAESPSVQLPLDHYHALLQQPGRQEFALGSAEVSVRIAEESGRLVARVVLTVKVSIFREGWKTVPFLPAGVTVEGATIDGSAVELTRIGQEIGWTTELQGSHTLQVRYRVNADRSATGAAVGIPIPPVTSVSLTGELPGTGLRPQLAPASSFRVSEEGGSTKITAAVPATEMVQLSWERADSGTFALSHSEYRGRLENDALEWDAEYRLSLNSDERIVVRLIPTSVALHGVHVDGKEAPLTVDGGSVAVSVQGRGEHRLTLSFHVPVNESGGPPTVRFPVPSVPVSRFELTLPGKKEVRVEPATSVSRREADGKTTAIAYAPMTDNIAFSWTEAIPEVVREESRVNASLYHTAVAEDGLLTMNARIDYEIPRGKVSAVSFALPADAQVNKVSSPMGRIVDWRIEKGENLTVSVFLDQEVTGSYSIDVAYDRSLPKGSDALALPLLRAEGVDRQRGLVALLGSKELSLTPQDEGGYVRVGENLLPVEIRQGLKRSVSQTLKYLDAPQALNVRLTKPERAVGRFDAVVNTLFSLGDVSLRGAASLEVNVKSGAVEAVDLFLPVGVNVLSLTAPSLRAYTVHPAGDRQRIDVQLTQELSGQFRIELTYERLTNERDEIVVPTVNISGAEVEQGRIALEALSTVEIEPSSVRNLSSLDAGELPEQLVKRTANPILLAYKYAHVEPPYELKLKVTRHREIETQAAVIDSARYMTLVTRDGTAVTVADFTVRNSRKQFLKLDLPGDAQVWSAAVDGKPEKPASDGARSVLLKIINSPAPFSVRIVYQSRLPEFGWFGDFHASLPRPDLVATRTVWSLFLPENISYGRVRSDMNVVTAGAAVSAEAMRASQIALEPIALDVPASGISFTLDKIYANQADVVPEVRIFYAAGAWRFLLLGIVALATLAFWLKLEPRSRGSALLVENRLPLLAAMLIGVLVGYCGVDYRVAVAVSAAAIAAQLFQGIRGAGNPSSDGIEDAAAAPPLP